jgi:hypothetical protein
VSKKQNDEKAVARSSVGDVPQLPVLPEVAAFHQLPALRDRAGRDARGVGVRVLQQLGGLVGGRVGPEREAVLDPQPLRAEPHDPERQDHVHRHRHRLPWQDDDREQARLDEEEEGAGDVQPHGPAVLDAQPQHGAAHRQRALRAAQRERCGVDVAPRGERHGEHVGGHGERRGEHEQELDDGVRALGDVGAEARDAEPHEERGLRAHRLQVRLEETQLLLQHADALLGERRKRQLLARQEHDERGGATVGRGRRGL